MRYEHSGGVTDRMRLKVGETGHRIRLHLVHAADVNRKARQGRCAKSNS
jgi:hypothetical protein